ncbi:hypothetical protein L1887_49066 [Cichorium endivia]|nr:hypothetical protein L1887_49066 [Cichorium endivia]
MQGQNWSGQPMDQQQNFNPSFFNGDGNMGQEAMQNMFQNGSRNDMANQAFAGFDPSAAAHNFQQQQSQMMMAQHAFQSRQMDAEASQTLQFRSMVPNAWIPLHPPPPLPPTVISASTALHPLPHPDVSRKRTMATASLVGAYRRRVVWTGMPNAMPDYMQNGAGSTRQYVDARAFQCRFPCQRQRLRARRSQLQQQRGFSPRQAQAHDLHRGAHPTQPDSERQQARPPTQRQAAPAMNGINSIGSTPAQLHAPDGQPAHFARPPFRHRRSRSGSEVVGPPGFGQRSFSSIELGSGLQDPYAAGLWLPTTALFISSRPAAQPFFQRIAGARRHGRPCCQSSSVAWAARSCAASDVSAQRLVGSHRLYKTQRLDRPRRRRASRLCSRLGPGGHHPLCEPQCARFDRLEERGTQRPQTHRVCPSARRRLGGARDRPDAMQQGRAAHLLPLQDQDQREPLQEGRKGHQRQRVLRWRHGRGEGARATSVRSEVEHAEAFTRDWRLHCL